MMEIQLTKGMVSLVDEIDYLGLSVHKWYAHFQPGCANGATYYATRENKSGTLVYMHRVILAAPEGIHVDHKNLDGLDNRRENLRVCTPSQNQANKMKQKGVYTSKYKGVSSRGGRWRAYIVVNDVQHHLGYYANEWAAAEAYNVAAVRVFGEFSRLNEVSYEAS